ncbi:hypothetical protein N7492_010133 [Penicillium capsulatum]|uniref:Uncharacterized protein n=1 Tax=Penicillium capsulatum TaxID=69766 RepID=A0A9W9LEV2_9EURO|nr:hypothetical protein N7492_010133 [Penicillium capsulatum]KAJ6112641.1 hypothetical protein N7512_007965 [Penicillium capsulatum]
MQADLLFSSPPSQSVHQILICGDLPAYTFAALGMISSMAEECTNLAVKAPRAIALSVPVGGIAGLLFVIPLCATLPPLDEIVDAPAFLVLIVTLFGPIGITVAASRSTWAVARDDALPLARLWAHIHPGLGVPVWSLLLLTVIQMLLGLINLRISSAFTAFVSVGMIALAVIYAIPISLSLINGRTEVSRTRWTCGHVVGTLVNVLALAWIAFELVLFSMPTALPVTPVSMNYAPVVFVGFLTISATWLSMLIEADYIGPPESDALE